MNHLRASALLALVLIARVAIATTPLTTGFTYQGQLKDGGSPASGLYDMTFTVFDAAIAGNQVGSTLTGDDIATTNGVFTTTLDFGNSVFTGTARWLEIAARPGGSAGSYTPLTPRQPLTAAPYALFSAAPWITSGNTIAYNAGNVGIGTGMFTPVAPLDARGTVSNYGVVHGTQVAGSTSGAGVYGRSNLVSGNGVIGEAYGPQAYGVWGKTDTGYAVYGSSTGGYGGYFNGKGYFSGSVGIGTPPDPSYDLDTNHIRTQALFVGSRLNDVGISFGSTGVGGEIGVSQPGSGYNMIHLHDNPHYVEMMTNTAIMRDSPQFPLHVGNSPSNGNGAHVTIGGVWTNGSDRNTKRDFHEIDKRAILEKLAALPVTQWQYKSEKDGVKHIGPVAQDFYAAFGLGDEDRYIGTLDSEGVALAAIQALHGEVREKDCQISAQQEQIAELRAALQALNDRVQQLAAATSQSDDR